MKKFENFCRALENLSEINEYSEPYNSVTLAGITGLFEICFELAWKAMKEILEDHGRIEQKIGSPKMIIKLAFSAGLIDDEKMWLDLIETRNLLSHTYDEENALKAARKIKSDFIGLFEKLKKEAEERWI